MNRALARSTDPWTAKQAAFTFDPEPIEVRVLMALAVYQFGATTHEIAGFLGLSLVSVSPRFRPLVRRGKVRDSGRVQKIGRVSRIIWEIVP